MFSMVISSHWTDPFNIIVSCDGPYFEVYLGIFNFASSALYTCVNLLFSSGSLLDSIHLGQGPTKFLVVFIDLFIGLTKLFKNSLINCLSPLHLFFW